MNNSAIGKSWDEVRAELFTSQELEEMESRVKFMHAIANAHKKKKGNKICLKLKLVMN